MRSPVSRGAAAPRPRPRRLPRRVRRATWWGVPLMLAAGSIGLAMLSRTPPGQAVLNEAMDRAIEATAALGLVVSDIEVEGRETTDTATIMAALAAARGSPSLAVSPSRAKEQLETLPWVRSATIERRLPGTLFVRLVERHPLALWQHGGKLELIDRDGAVIPVGDLGRFARLPMVVGDEAAGSAAALLDMLAAEPDLAARVTAAVRIGNRRWNLRIDNAIDVLLPEEDVGAAWTRLARIERTSSLLKREVQAVDLRLPDRLVLRVTAAPAHDPAPGKKAHSAGKAT